MTFFAAVLSTSAAFADDKPDAWVTLKTKVQLMTANDLNTGELNVDTVKGVVTLHGMVATEMEKGRAGKIAAGVDGVHEVKNLLQVVPKSQRKMVEQSDDQIKASVEGAFKANHRIAESGIKVASVNKGAVLLSGKSKSFEAYAESVGVAYAVKGVQRVSSEVTVNEATQ